MGRHWRSTVIQYVVIPEGICIAVKEEKFWTRIQRRDMSLYLMPLYPKFTAMEVKKELTCSVLRY